METNRDKELEEIINFSEDVDKRINEMLESIDWKPESVENVEESINCPFDSNHRLLNNNKIEQHLERCMWKAEGYHENDIPLSELCISSDSSSCIKFDEKLLEEVLSKSINSSENIKTRNRLIPRTSDRLTADFSADEKRLVYDYVIANTVSPEIGQDIADLSKPKNEETSKTSSYLELLAQERNLKRRKTKYRGVHTNKKSQVEILREVINQQMEMLAEHIQQNEDKPEELKKEDAAREDGYQEDRNRKRNYFDDGRRHDDHHRPFRRSKDEEDHSGRRNGHKRNGSNDFGYEYKHENRSRSKKYDERHEKHLRRSSKDRDRHVHRDAEEKTHRSSHSKKHKRHKSKERESSRHKKSKHHSRDYDYDSKDKKRK